MRDEHPTTRGNHLERIEELVAGHPSEGVRPAARNGRVGSLLQRGLYRVLRGPLLQDREWRVAVRDALAAQEAVLAEQRYALREAADDIAALRELMDRGREAIRDDVAILSRRVEWLGERAGSSDADGLG